MASLRLVNGREYLRWRRVAHALALSVSLVLNFEIRDLARISVRICVGTVGSYASEHVIAPYHALKCRVRRPVRIDEPVRRGVEPVGLEPRSLLNDIPRISIEVAPVIVLLDRIKILLSIIDHVPSPAIL